MKKLNVTLFQKEVIDVPSLPLGERLCPMMALAVKRRNKPSCVKRQKSSCSSSRESYHLFARSMVYVEGGGECEPDVDIRENQ